MRQETRDFPAVYKNSFPLDVITLNACHTQRLEQIQREGGSPSAAISFLIPGINLLR